MNERTDILTQSDLRIPLKTMQNDSRRQNPDSARKILTQYQTHGIILIWCAPLDVSVWNILYPGDWETSPRHLAWREEAAPETKPFVI